MPLPQLVGRQQEVVYLPAEGHTVILGTAGSGKTAMAIFRAAFLAVNHTPNTQRVLLVTFNKSLTKYLQAWAGPDLPASVDVETYHHFALGYLSNITGQNRINVLNDKSVKKYIVRKAIEQTQNDIGDHEVLKTTLDNVLNEFEWIEKVGSQSLNDYQLIDRFGGGISRINQADRQAVYYAFEQYKTIRNNNGYHFDWDDIANEVINQFTRDQTARRYKHIVIDEGQDFSTSMLRSLVLALPQNGSLTFFGDIAQQIYGSRVSWRSAGLTFRVPWEFRENYRNSRQIAKLGIAISNMPYYLGVADMVQPREPKADGPLPVLAQCQALNHEMNECAQLAARYCRTQVVAILMRDRVYEEAFSILLRRYSVIPIRLHRDTASWNFAPGVYIGTYHSAKGLEFDTVILPFCNEGTIPSPTRAIEVGNEAEALSDEGRLLYVAVTRAKNNLVMTYSGVLTSLLPIDDSLYDKVIL